jgi:hypothetical protein
MKSIDLDNPLHPTAIELLLALVDTAKQYQLQTIPCREVRVRREPWFEEDRDLTPQPDPLGSLQKMGLVERLNSHVRLGKEAFERAKYERKGRLGKWWARMIYRVFSRLEMSR